MLVDVSLTGIRPSATDGAPRADVVMVFPCKPSPLVRGLREANMKEPPGLRPPTDPERQLMEAWHIRRQCATAALNETGLSVMPFFSRDKDKVFVKLGACEALLGQAADASRYKLQLKPEFLSAFVEYRADCSGELYQVHHDEDAAQVEEECDPETVRLRPRRVPPPSIFRTADRIRLVDHIVRSVDHDSAGIDVGELMRTGEMLAYFPLHEQRKLASLDTDWFKAFAWGSHTDKVRCYFGERVAMYFLLVGHLHRWLLLPASVGLLVLLVDFLASSGSADNFLALPLCAGACAWSALLPHCWRRRAAVHALRWGTLGLAPSAEPARPEYWGDSKLNPVTWRLERHYPWKQRVWKVVLSYSVISVCLLALAGATSLMLAIRHLFALMGGSRLPFQILTAVLVDATNCIFSRIARNLTNVENHRAQSEYSRHLLSKTIVFRFVNCYALLFYIAFLKEHSQLVGMATGCPKDDCLSELASQLVVFLLVRLAIQSFVELAWPYVWLWYRRLDDGHALPDFSSFLQRPPRAAGDSSRAEREGDREEHDVCEDVDEVLILFGYASLFVVACPWAPFLVLVNSLANCFLNEKKLVLLVRRPFPAPAASLEPWDSALEFVGGLAVVTNSALAAFASPALRSWSSRQRVILFIAMEHLVLLLRWVVGLALPAVPRTVLEMRQRQEAWLLRHPGLGRGDRAGEEATKDGPEASSSRMAPRPQTTLRQCLPSMAVALTLCY